METVTIKDVVGPNDNGWFEVALGDGRTTQTKDKQVAQTAFQAKGQTVQVEVRERKNGRFTNIFLNKVEPATDHTETLAEVGLQTQSIPSYEDKQKLIAAQWAVGRAVEEFVAGKIEAADIEDTARSHLALSRKLAAE